MPKTFDDYHVDDDEIMIIMITATIRATTCNQVNHTDDDDISNNYDVVDVNDNDDYYNVGSDDDDDDDDDDKHVRVFKSFYSFFRWKIHESCMLAMGCIKSLIIDKVSNGKVSMADMTSFLTQVVLADLQESGNNF